MKNSILTIILLLPFLGLSQSDKSFVGEYASGSSGLPMGYDWFLGNSYADGVELLLNNAGTFRYQACTILQGVWKTKNDSLFLYVESSKWKNDSLNRVGFNGKFLEVPKEPLKLEIIENGFRRDLKFDYKGRTYNSINKLIKVPASKKGQ